MQNKGAIMTINLSALKEKIEKEKSELSKKTQVIVYQGTCGYASGAQEILEALKKGGPVAMPPGHRRFWKRLKKNYKQKGSRMLPFWNIRVWGVAISNLT
jgi:hypothetical protein